MALLFRKLSKISGWPDGKYTHFTSVDSICADAITNGLNTVKNELSWWMAKDELEFKEIAAGFIGTYEDITWNTRFVILDTKVFDSKGLRYRQDPSNGHTIFENDKKNHFEVIDNDYAKLGIIAEIIAKCTDKNINIKSIKWKDAVSLIQKRIRNKETVNHEKMGNALKTELGI